MKKQNDNTQKRGIIITVCLALAFVAFVIFSLWYKMQRPVIIADDVLKAYGIYVFEQPRLVKPFQLLDQNAKPFGKENLQGKWSFIFFGFTHCPDICPTTLSKFKEIKNTLQGTEVFSDTNFIFVSLDPERDKPAQLKPYIEYFDPTFMGLTGEFLAIYNFSSNLNVAFKKVLLQKDYTIDHSANIVLINANGDYQGFLKPPFDAQKIKQAYRSIRYMHR